MKNKWKGSALAKFAAWVGITISGVLFVASVLSAYVMLGAGIYDATSEKEYRRKLYETVASQYAIQALSEMENTDKNKWNDTYFRYGIIEAEDISDVDFNDESIYVERNFTEKVTADDLYMVSHELGDNVQYVYSDNLFGGKSVSISTTEALDSAYISDVIYNIDMGIFYYATADYLFPVREVKLGYTTNEARVIYTLTYDFTQDMYCSQGANIVGVDSSGVSPADGEDVTEKAEAEVGEETGEAEETVEEITEELEVAAEDMIYYEEADRILNQQYVTLDMLDSTAWNCWQWEYVVLDGKQYINNNGQIVHMDNSDVAQYAIASETDYEVTEDNFIKLHYDDGEKENTTKTYWVVVLLPENVGTGWSGDLFVQANTLVSLGYSLRYSIYLIGAASFAVMVALLVFLLNAAGHRRGTDEIVACWIDKIPFDLYLGTVLCAEFMFIYVLVSISYSINQIPLMIIFAIVFICMSLLALLTLLSFAVRVKLGKWWRNTLIWRMLHWVCELARKMTENISLLWKCILIMGGLAFLEFIGICLLQYSATEALLLVWFFEKVVLFVIVVLAVNQLQRLKEGGGQLAAGNLEHRIATEKMYWEFKQHGENLNSISTGMARAVDERMKSERFKTELITNVSHDIKTPLTSIINYVDLLEKEELHNETATEYLEVLERQSARLKKLIEDLMEASKASTGNLAVNLEKLEAGVSLVQTVGEFEEKTSASGLELLITKPETAVYIMADSRHFWRVIDNLMNNICKYAQPATRVYINLEEKEGKAVFTFRNTSKCPLNITSEELMERFVRGDSSRNTEGSGLGLNIASSLMELMGGTFELYVDGDLFKVVLTFDVISA